ncbi:MAG: hypothetical protein MSH25_03195 [Desulfovibrio sp.]|uniref:hypothetical protein n=1 Tax=Desulfovibrio sp. TaxID=885 RepID=UPI0025BF71F3|nr:hypothetical protein [Desulfovibrio sp.]MCI7568369.1 hypothetical protein [Desulfovibrio sp.]
MAKTVLIGDNLENNLQLDAASPDGSYIAGLSGDDRLSGGNQFDLNEYVSLYGGTGNDVYELDTNSIALIRDVQGDDSLKIPFSIDYTSLLAPYGYMSIVDERHLYMELAGMKCLIADYFGAGKIEHVQFTDGEMSADTAMRIFGTALQHDSLSALGADMANRVQDSIDLGDRIARQEYTGFYGQDDSRLALDAFFDEQTYLANKAAAMNAQNAGSFVTSDAVALAIADAGMTPLSHFMTYGAFETAADGSRGINPGTGFDVEGYFTQKVEQMHRSGYLDADLQGIMQTFQAAGLDPVTHYALYGYKEGLSPDGTSAGFVPEAGYVERFQASFFDEQQYLLNKTAAINADASGDTPVTVEDVRAAIEAAGMTTWEHYHLYGAYERNADGELGIDPGKNFDTSAYYADKLAQLQGTGDVSTVEQLAQVFRNVGLDPVTHYAMYGYDEGVTPQSAVAVSLQGVEVPTESPVEPA